MTDDKSCQLLAVQPYLVPLHGRLPPHDKLIASNRVPLHAKYRFASWIITNITHHCNVPSVATQPTVTHSYTSSLPTGKTQLCNQQASSSSSSSNFQQSTAPLCSRHRAPLSLVSNSLTYDSHHAEQQHPETLSYQPRYAPSDTRGDRTVSRRLIGRHGN